MRTSSSSPLKLGALLLFALSCAPVLFIVGCASYRVDWDESRRVYVDEVNQLLHHDLPRVLRENDLDKLLALYTQDARSSEKIRGAKRELLAPYREIVRTHSVITKANAIELGTTATATIDVQVHGVTHDGSRRSRFLVFDVTCEREAGAWRIASEKQTSARVAMDAPALYRDESLDRGIWNTPAVIEVPDHDGSRQLYPAGSGLAVGDINDDGHDDLYLTNGSECRLFINRGDGHFDDATVNAGCDGKAGGGDARLALLCDFDSDGRTDIFVGKIYAPNILYRQNEDGTFTDVTAKSGLVPTIETNAACAADFDGNGHVDIFVVNYRNPYVEDPDPPYNALNGLPNYLFLNNGDGTFRDASKESGVDHPGYGLSCAAADFDLDGDVDLFVGNDFGFDVLYRNRGDGTFDDVTDETGMTERRSTMSAAWADLDGDEFPELYCGSMFSNSKWMVQQPGYPVPAPWPVRTLFGGYVLDLVDEMLAGNLFLRNRGGKTFEPFAPETVNTGWAWSSVFLDVDNDRRQDLYAVNGFVSGENPNDL